MLFVNVDARGDHGCRPPQTIRQKVFDASFTLNALPMFHRGSA
jgi:hypothetical protein